MIIMNNTIIEATLFDEIKIADCPIIPPVLFEKIITTTLWNDDMRSRKTASYGVPYNYSGMKYEPEPIPDYFHPLIKFVHDMVGFTPNNCLLNYYENGSSRMGFHSDNIDILSEGTGIAIFSLGSPRVMRFKSKLNESISVDLVVNNGSFFYMTQEVQRNWLHSILTDDDNLSKRISVTFRNLKYLQ